MSSTVDTDARRAQVSSAKKKLKQFRASRTGVPSATSPPLTTGGMVDSRNAMPRRGQPLKSSPELAEDMPTFESAPPRAHSRKASRHHRRDSSMASFSFPAAPPVQRPDMFDLPAFDSSHVPDATPTLEHDNNKAPAFSFHEVITTPATPVDNALEEHAIARLSAFSFGSKSQPPQGRRSPLNLAQPTSRAGKPALTRPPPFPLDLANALDSLPPRPTSRPSSPTRKKRHSHNRSESISLPNLKLGRPASLGLPSPGFNSTPSSPLGEASSRSSMRLTPANNRLKFEPSDKEKEESRRRALDKLTGGPPRKVEEKRHSITLPAFDDDDDLSVTSSRPPSSTIHSTASSSRPSSLAASSGSYNGGSLTSPLPWSTFEDNDRWSFPSRFEIKEEMTFDFPAAPSKTSSVLLNSGLGVLAEEDETESDDDRDAADTEVAGSTVSAADATLTPEEETLPTPSRLRELHLVTSSSIRRGSNPEVRESFTRSTSETPPKTFSTRRPRPLIDENVFASATSPVGRIGRSNSLNSKTRRTPSSLGSSISYKKDNSDSGSSRDFSARGLGSPTAALNDLSSPISYTHSPLNEHNQLPRANPRPPRPRSMILGLGVAGRVLGEVDEADEDSALGFRNGGGSAGRGSFESSHDSLDLSAWTRRDSRDRIDAEMERDALRDDVDQWRTRCRGLEDKLEAERRETTLLRERVRKLSDRILEQSAAHAAIPSPTEDAQSRLVADMRNQLFSFASALEREQKEKADALAQIAELQALLDSFKTPQIAAESLPATPKSRPRATLPASVSEDLSHFADADDAELEPVPEAAAFSDNPEDPNFTRMRGFSFPSGPVEPTDAQSKRHSFFNLSRARPVRAPKASGSGLGLDWPMQAQDDRLHDLPPIVVDDTNRSLITPVSPSRTAFNATTGRVVSEPLRNKPQTHQTSERQIPTSSSTGSFALSFLSGYLTIPRSAPIPAPPPGPQLPIPRISVTPSSVSPKKSLLHLERDVFNARVGSVAYGCEVNFRHCCNRCTGDIIEL